MEHGSTVSRLPSRERFVWRRGYPMQRDLIFHREIGASTGRSALSTTQLRQRLLEETDRSLAFHRPVSLLCLQFSGPLPSRPALLDSLGSVLRISDSVAWAGNGSLLILLPERDATGASKEAERLFAALASVTQEVRVGVVSCPRDGSDPDALLLASQSAAQSSSQPGTQVAVEDTAVTVDLGDTKILLVEPAMKKLYALIERLAKQSCRCLSREKPASARNLQPRRYTTTLREGEAARLSQLLCLYGKSG